MDEDQVAKLVGDTLRWSSDRASSPAIIEIESSNNTIELTAVPGRRFRLTVEELPV